MGLSTEELIARMLRKNAGQILERVELLEQAVAAWPLDEAARVEAVATAHRLAGSLGMYGMPQGTEAARKLEQGFEDAGVDRGKLVRWVRVLREAVDARLDLLNGSTAVSCEL